MAHVWARRGKAATAQGTSRRREVREAKYRYQEKELALTAARAELTRLGGLLRLKRSTQVRLHQSLEQRRLELLLQENEQRTLQSALQELEGQVSTQEARVRRLERDVLDLREAAAKSRHEER